MQGMMRDTAVVETLAGEQVLSRNVVDDEATAHAVVSDVLWALQRGKVATPTGGFAACGLGQYLVVGEYVQRHRVVEAACTVLDEHITNTGDWLAVVQAEHAPVIAGLTVMPVLGGFEAAGVNLRLVG
jgi:hypothetical protein